MQKRISVLFVLKKPKKNALVLEVNSCVTCGLLHTCYCGAVGLRTDANCQSFPRKKKKEKKRKGIHAHTQTRTGMRAKVPKRGTNLKKIKLNNM